MTFPCSSSRARVGAPSVTALWKVSKDRLPPPTCSAIDEPRNRAPTRAKRSGTVGGHAGAPCRCASRCAARLRAASSSRRGARRGRRRIHHAARRTQLPADRARKQRKVRAAEHDGVDARIEMREIALGDGIDGLAFAPALFGQRHEYLARHLGDMRVGTQRDGWRADRRRRAPCLRWRAPRCARCADASQAACAPGSMTPITGSVGKSFAQARAARWPRPCCRPPPAP